LSFRASLPKNKELFLHLLEQNHRIDPSFLTNIMPVPGGNSVPQNEHFFGLGMIGVPHNCDSKLSVDFLCFPFGLSQHQDILASHWPLDIARYDTSLIFSFEDSHPNLSYFASHACAADDLYHFSRYEFKLPALFGFPAHH